MPCFEVGVLLLIAFAVRAYYASLDFDDLFDEFYHLLAARSWATEGSLRIGDGVYPRGSAYTIALGWMFRLFGESEAVARFPSMLAGSLWVAAVFLWTRWAAGRLAAWIAALLFCFAPGALELSIFIRFYAWHGLAFWLAAIGLYALLTRPVSPTSTSAIAVATALSFALAFHLQITSLIGLAGIGLWAALASRSWWFEQLSKIRGVGPRLALLGLVVLAAGIAVQSGLVSFLLTAYQYIPGWMDEGETYDFYHRQFLRQFPTLWTLLPLAALIAIVRKPGPGSFCACLFGTCFVLHSFAGMKAEKYIYYAMPGFFVLWGIAIQEIVERTRSMGIGALLGKGEPTLASAWKWAALAALLLFLVVGNGRWTYRLLAGERKVYRIPSNDWEKVQDELRPFVDEAAVVLTSEPLRLLYYFDRFDIRLAKRVVDETDTGEEFGIDPRNGRPVIGTTESVELVLKCHPDGLFVNRRTRSAPTLAYELRKALDRLDIPVDEIELSARRVQAYRWQRPEMERPPECKTLPGLAPAGRR